VVLGRLELGRDVGKPLAGDLTFGGAPYPGDTYLPVLVCVDVEKTSSGWLTVDDAAVATPSHFHPSVKRLQYAGIVDRRTGKLAGTIAGAPGATLRARVIADPGRYPTQASGGAGAASVAGAKVGVLGGAGCGTAGLGPFAGLALLALLRLRRR
jgi:uncharacterized protein (TIGR03382 family)